jgi:hypothetical protein
MELPRGTGAKSLKSPLIVAGAQPYRKDTMLDTYGHVMTDEKIAAQGSMLERIMPKTNAVQ